ncbi:MAG TPA: zf-HC2 domain-containing protein [Terracidiphilus sp.]|jgi:Putative zinc-finger|nr:zf-HC2 domain-containing protein [Terracidiphilus sp.]
MAERTHIPSSPACGQWETLLADALDGLLLPADEATFAAHMAACPACTALFEEARRGREWLEFLSPEPEVPAGLVDKILAHTGPGHAAALPLVADGSMLPVAQGITPGWQRPGFMGFVHRFAEPRLMMTAAMAFFSIALTLNITGVRLTSLRLSDLRPMAIRSFMERQLTMASVPIIRYYDHLRFVYEVESKMRELRGTTPEGQQQNDNNQQPNNVQPGESKKGPAGQNPPHKDGGSRVDPPQQSGNPGSWPAPVISGEVLESSLTFEALPAHSGGSAQQYGKGAWYGLRES